MESGIIVLIGEIVAQPSWFDSLVKASGWRTKAVASLDTLRVLADSDIVAVFFHAGSLELPWKDCLVWIHSIAPEARCIVCHGFREDIDWPSLANWGAFHSLPLPLDPAEVRQALGFLAMDGSHSITNFEQLPRFVSESG